MFHNSLDGGHLVIGVKDGSIDIVGIQDFHFYDPVKITHKLTSSCLNLSSEGLRVESFVTSDTDKEVWVIHIPKHRPRLPVYAHQKAWQRVGDSLVAMRPERLDAILSEPDEHSDWSAAVIDGATLADLDGSAVDKAREKFKETHADKPWKDDIDKWEVSTLLDKAKVTVHGSLTRAAILLLGKPEASYFLSPNPAQITWKLESEDEAYQHFGPPFILNTTEVMRRIRNVPQRLFPQNQLLAIEIQKYETPTILEALHNCIAHQDYERAERVLVVEKPDRIVFENAGSFVEGKAEDYFTGNKVPRCSVPSCDGISLTDPIMREVLWDRYFTAAPRPRTQSELQYSDRKLRPRR